jgi:hypothetical protein
MLMFKKMTTIKKPTPERLREYRLNPLPFIEDMVVLENGKLIELEDWQRKVIKEAFQRDKNGNLRFNIILLSVPKKNGKTTLMAACLLWALFAHTPNAEVYCLSGDIQQGKIAFDKVAKMIMRNPLLRDSCKIMKNEIYVPETDSIFRVLSTDSPTNHGVNASFVGIDELWQFEGTKDEAGRELWYAMTHSPTREAVTMVTTYAGSDENSILGELYHNGIKKSDPKQYTFWSHDNLSKWVSKEYLEQQRMRMPAQIFQRLHENRWTQGANAFITRAELEKCIDQTRKPQLGGKDNIKYYLAVDLGLTRDRTVLTVCHKSDADNLVYLDYIRTFSGTKNNPVLISDVEEAIMSCNKSFNIFCNILDPWQMKSTAERLKRLIKIEEFTFTSNSIQKLSQNLYYLFHNGLIRIFPHKLLEEELLSLNAEEKSYGWRIDHKSGGFSDHSVSLGMASMYAVQESGNDAGFIITGAPSIDKFQEQLKAEKLSGPTIIEIKEVKERESINYKQDFPTLKELEEWRKSLQI